ncbi:ciliary microtubule inner protein 2B isoform X2 [Alligator mississippiensis]|uniref:ciliary microtubule inner protein 2B isoform X2 n=1 Tax=Alligator mississippiensis TaxID=8496 RepID=UPI002877EAD5|nr:ciliary microtubule inner protein 2B isoform X2 [Alligator mississippiensis]
MATAFAPKISQVLMTPDPHHIPGYAGYCPQYKFRLGRTYGKLTSQLLTCPEVARSPHLVLQPTQGPCGNAQPPEQEEKLLEVPRAGWGAGILPVSCSMIPGYTGFIPRAQHFFAKTYLEICKEARSDFARQQRRSWGGQEQPRACQPCLDPAQGSKEPAAGIPGSDHRLLPTVMGMAPLPAAAAPHGSPYSMEDDNPHKYFISGFTGFVPRARFLIGAGFPITTHRALLEFARMSRKDGSKPRAMGTSSLLPPLGRTYPAAGGLLPNYTGYIPGYKFQFGRTYGHLTHDALHLGLPEKQRPE